MDIWHACRNSPVHHSTVLTDVVIAIAEEDTGKSEADACLSLLLVPAGVVSVLVVTSLSTVKLVYTDRKKCNAKNGLS